jgi:hypothetical protein
VDEGCECTTGDSRPCGLDVGECSSGTQTCTGGVWGSCQGAVGPFEEICDGLDNDCDGTVDEGCLCADGDSRVCGLDMGECTPGTQTCIGGTWGGCEGSIDPEPEQCNGVDDTRPCGNDVGECQAGLQTCVDSTWSGCEGAVWPTEELCDGLDNDCNGVADNDAVCPAGERCVDGTCVAEEIPIPDPEPDGWTLPDDSGEKPGCGCLVAGRGTGSMAVPTVLLLISLLLAAAALRRRKP